MLRFREGDRSAFDVLFARYTPRLVNFLARMVLDRSRAEELAQETFVRIYQARDSAFDPGPGPDELLSADKTTRAIERALHALPARQRAALLLRTQEEQGYDEIAAVLGVSVSSVKSLLHRAREALLAAVPEAGE
jgi:RNA polymerase sigma-70 factor (ECF subfamily)